MKLMRTQPKGVCTLAMTLCLAAHHTDGNMASVSASDIQRTGNLVLRQKAAIQLDYENLAVRLDAETATVSVIYEFTNHGSDEDVTIGFPIDLMPSEGTSYNLGHWYEDSLTGFQMSESGKRVAIERTIDEPLSAESRPAGVQDVSIQRRWSITSLHFKRGEHKVVRVNYTVRCIGVNSGFEGTMENSKFTPRTFIYTLRPGGTWGTGHVGKLDITIDAAFLRLNEFEINVEPEPQTRAAGKFRWSLTNFDLKSAPDVVCIYDATPALFQRSAERVMFKQFENLRLKLSDGAHSNTGPLIDRNPETIWFANAKTKGIDTTFEFRPRKDTSISQVAILNGCVASEEQYRAYARIKRLRIEYVVRFDEGPKRESSEQVMPDRKFDERVRRFPTYYADVVDLPGGPEGILEYVKLTVLDIYPGSQGKPAAISDLYVYGQDFYRP
jgi:hypothetical protein